MKESRILIVTRHAHRDRPRGADSDTGLSETGRGQARRLAEVFAERFPGRRPKLLCSPKLRCRETLLPLANATGCGLEIATDLDEGSPLGRKIRNFLEAWQAEEEPLVVLCSHGDWIPELIDRLIGSPLDFETGAWAEFEFEESAGELKPALRAFFQRP